MSSEAPRLPYRPGVDGLRTVAVLAVLLYHAGVTWAPGGFLGVDVFLVISGFLITSLLLAERGRTGRVDLPRFWLRRARRLLPAAFLVIGVCLVFGAVFLRDDLGALRADALASFLYVQNWHQILAEQSYFDSFGRPSLLKHLWSLAVEEQFYLLWPLALAGGLALLGRVRLMGALAAAAVLSAVLMAVLYDPGADPSRVYYGTDTRAVGLLVGALLAFVWAPGRLRGPGGAHARALLDGAGLVALAVLVLCFWRVHDFDPALYRGGFLGISLATAVLVAVLVHPAARLGRWLGAAPLVWLGKRSYGIYLWHWPVLAMTRPELDVPAPRIVLVPLQAAAAIGLAAASYRWVEMPVRTGRAVPWLRGELERLAPRARLGVASGTTAALLAVGLWVFASPAGNPADARAVDTGDDPGAVAAASRTPTPTTSAVPPPGATLAVGSSVMLASRAELNERLGPKLTLDASVARQAADVIAVLQGYRDAGPLPERVVVQVGDNGPLLEDTPQRLREVLSGVDRVVLVTVSVPRRWEEQVNDQLRALVSGWPQARLADWKAFAAAKPGLLYDGVHPVVPGRADYADLVARALRSR